MNRSLKLFFTLSLMLNLLLAGVVGGMAGKGFMPPPPPHMPPPEVLNTWPQDKREAFQHVMDKVGKDTESLRDELRDAHTKASDIVKADKFDKAAYLEQVKRIHELHGKLAEHMSLAIADLAGQWDQKDRALLADAVRGPLMPPPPGGPHGDQPPPPPAN